ncbi:MAG: hypothetical protein WD627_00560 [Actinomycetota bacterium]
MARLKALGPAIVNGLATYTGVVILVFFIDELLASIDMPTFTGWLVLDPDGEGNAVSGRDAIAIVSGAAVGVATLVRRLRAERPSRDQWTTNS